MQTTIPMTASEVKEVRQLLTQLDAVQTKAFLIFAETLLEESKAGTAPTQAGRKAAEKAAAYFRTMPGYELNAQTMIDTQEKWEQEHNS